MNSDLDELELLPSATIEDIKAKYRTLALRYHPDTGAKDGGEKFRRVTAAYQRLLKNHRPTKQSPIKHDRTTFYRILDGDDYVTITLPYDADQSPIQIICMRLGKEFKIDLEAHSLPKTIRITNVFKEPFTVAIK